MKTTKRLIMVLCCLLATTMTLTIQAATIASGTCGKNGDNLTWTLTDDGNLIIDGTGEMQDYSYYFDTPWYSNKGEIKTVTISNNVTTIGDNAFYYCSTLTSVTIGNSVTIIGNSAFENCYRLTSVTIGNSVTTIGEAAFDECRGLTSINVDEANKNYCTIDGVLFDKDTTSIIKYPAQKKDVTQYTIPNSVTTIGETAFGGCGGLTSITIPNSVTTIGEGAFSGCTALTSITIPNSVTTIGAGAFKKCSSLPIENSLRYADIYLVEAVEDLPSYTIKEGTKFIGSSVFAYHSDLTSITIPNSVTTIGGSAFSGCSNLTSVTIPNSVTAIELAAFNGCSGLTSVTIGNSVTTICNSAFSGCSSLTSVTIPNSVTTIEPGAFYGCSSLTSVTIPNSVTIIGDGVFYGCSGLTSITIPNSVTSIGSNVFECCGNLTSITCLAKRVPTLGNDALGVNPTIHVLLGCGDAYRANDNWKNFNIVEDAVDPYSRTITLGASDYGTYCSDVNLDLSEVDGLKAYIASSFYPSTGVLTITRVTNVPAGEGVLIKGTAGESYDVPTTDEINIVANLLKGTTSAMTLDPTDGGCTNYVLTKNSEGAMGFYRFTGSVAMPANRAWLQIPNAAIPANALRGFKFVEEGDDMTGVTDIEIKSAGKGNIYDLQGRRINHHPTHGVYIQNGKKIVK